MERQQNIGESTLQYFFKQFKTADLNHLYLFSNNKQFNKINYESCINLIQYVYRIYLRSMQQIIYSDQINKESYELFGFEKTFLIQSYLSFPNPSQTICGIVGELKSQKLLIIGIRGSVSTGDIFAGFQSLFQDQILNPFKNDNESNEIGDYTFMSGISQEQIDYGAIVGKGWYKYCYTIQSMKNSNYCYSDSSCRVLSDTQYSKINNKCLEEETKECSENAQNIVQQLLNILSLYDSEYEIIVCGHSLGACGAILFAFNYNLIPQHLNINSIYLYGSPKVGNDIFIKQLESMNLSIYNVINDDDIFTKFPFSFREINPSIRFNDPFQKGIISSHDPQTYLKNSSKFFSLIEKI